MNQFGEKIINELMTLVDFVGAKAKCAPTKFARVFYLQKGGELGVRKRFPAEMSLVQLGEVIYSQMKRGVLPEQLVDEFFDLYGQHSFKYSR